MSFRQFINLMIGTGVICVLFLLFSVSSYINTIKTTEISNGQAISTIKFPMNYCGDYSAGGANIWHYVYISYNQDNLTNIRHNFCCDAYYNKPNNTIVIASFYKKDRADSFVKILNSKGFKGIKVGSQKITIISPSKQKIYSCR